MKPVVRLSLCILLWMFAGSPPGLAQSEVTQLEEVVLPASIPTVSFVYAESVFDTLYHVFRRFYPVYMKEFWDEVARKNRNAYTPFDYATSLVVVNGGLGVHLVGAYKGEFYSRDLDKLLRDTLESLLLPAVAAVRDRPGYSVEDEKERLVCQLETFGDTATAFPTVYGLIATKYRGDVRAYVDALFNKSVMTSKRRMRSLMRSPYIRRVETDMGFHFAVSKLLYRLWELHGRPVPPVVDGPRLVILRSELEQEVACETQVPDNDSGEE